MDQHAPRLLVKGTAMQILAIVQCTNQQNKKTEEQMITPDGAMAKEAHTNEIWGSMIIPWTTQNEERHG
jgi:hypothetical protein